MILGETYRALREEKGISISSLAGADISKSQISRFELGETEISVFKLLYLLEKIGTTFEEFLLACNHYKPAEFTIFMNTVQSSAYQHDIHLLHTLAEQEKQFFEETQSHYHRLNFILIKSVLSRLTQVKLAEDELAYLSDYLLTIENWGYYETLLLGNCSHSLPPDLLYLYTKDALEKGQRYTSIMRNKEALINLLLNSLQVMIENRLLEQATYLVQTTTSLLTNSTYFFESCRLLFFEGYLEFARRGKSEQAMNKLEKALDIFQTFNSTIHHHYLDYYEKHILNQ